jgi:hypothetical protein
MFLQYKRWEHPPCKEAISQDILSFVISGIVELSTFTFHFSNFFFTMHKSYLIQAALALTASASASSPRPRITPREEIHVDVIRYLKCANLVTSKENRGWEKGMAAYYEDGAISGTGVKAENRAIFDMYTDMMDVFFNNKGRVYGADTSIPGNSLWADFEYPPEMANDYDMPPEGTFIGHAERKVGNQRWGYNCFVDLAWPDFKDEEYGKCMSLSSTLVNDSTTNKISFSRQILRPLRTT